MGDVCAALLRGAMAAALVLRQARRGKGETPGGGGAMSTQREEVL